VYLIGPLGYHIYCADPPLDEIPESDWFCVECVKAGTAYKKQEADEEPEVEGEPSSPKQRLGKRKRRDIYDSDDEAEEEEDEEADEDEADEDDDESDDDFMATKKKKRKGGDEPKETEEERKAREELRREKIQKAELAQKIKLKRYNKAKARMDALLSELASLELPGAYWFGLQI